MWVPELGVFVSLLLAASMSSCSSEEETRIVAQRARFRESVPEQYVIATCGTGTLAGCAREVVIAGRVITAEVTGPGNGEWRPVAELGAWVDQVSSMFEAALDLSGSLRQLEFEPRWHYVSEYHGDLESGRRVTCFLPYRVDLQECQAAGVLGTALDGSGFDSERLPRAVAP